jgi:hypothetical protein
MGVFRGTVGDLLTRGVIAERDDPRGPSASRGAVADTVAAYTDIGVHAVLRTLRGTPPPVDPVSVARRAGLDLGPSERRRHLLARAVELDNRAAATSIVEALACGDIDPAGDDWLRMVAEHVRRADTCRVGAELARHAASLLAEPTVADLAEHPAALHDLADRGDLDAVRVWQRIDPVLVVDAFKWRDPPPVGEVHWLTCVRLITWANPLPPLLAEMSGRRQTIASDPVYEPFRSLIGV